MTSRPDDEAFAHPYVAVDVVLLAVVDGELRVPLVRRDSAGVAGWGLPGAFLQADERIAEARARLLASKCAITGVDDREQRPLPPRDDPARDPRRRTLSLPFWAPVRPEVVGHLEAGPPPGAGLGVLELSRGRVSVRVAGRREKLAVDHLDIVRDAVTDLTSEVDHLSPAIGALPALVPDPFTTRDVDHAIRAIHALAGRPDIDTNALRRRLKSATLNTGQVEALGPGERRRPAELLRWA